MTRRAAFAALLGLALIAAEPKREPIAESIVASDLRQRNRLRLLVFGDSGTGNEDQRGVARHMLEECTARGGCDLALMLGDNLYGDGVDPPEMLDGRWVFDDKFAERFESVYAGLGPIDFWAIAGNHDWVSAESVATQIAYTRHSERWRFLAHDYAVPLLPDWIRIYGIDTTLVLAGQSDEQVERARAALCGGGGGWKILMGHHPLYSSGWHSNMRGDAPKLMEPLLGPLIEACGVHFYLSGHDHHQEHISAPAVEQIVQGAAGKVRPISRIGQRAAGVEQLAVGVIFGFALLEATPQKLEVRYFGHGKDQPYSAWHCRAYERESFGKQRQRSASCTP